MGNTISIIAILLSGLSIYISYNQNKKINRMNMKQNEKINKINMNARLYNEIFDIYLIERIPKARIYLRFENNKLVDSERICDTLADLRNSILYFRYADKNFYTDLCNQIDELEDYVMQCGNRESIQEEQGDVFHEIQDKLEKLYKTINDNYTGN